MSVISVGKEELFNIMQYTNLVRVRFDNNDVWGVFPILYSSHDGMDVLVDSKSIGYAGDTGNKVVFKFQRQGYEYIVNGEVADKSVDTPSTVTIRYFEAKKYYNLRKHIRFDTELKSEIRKNKSDAHPDSEVKHDNLWTGCIVRNISKGGAMVISDMELDLNTQVEMKIGFALGEGIEVCGKVLRKSETGSNNFSYGVQFDHVAGSYANILNREITRLEDIYFRSLNVLREYNKSSDSKFDTKLVIFSYDLDESYDIRESLIKLGAENFDVINNFKFYFDYLTEEKPRIIIIDTHVINDEIQNTIRNISADFPQIQVQLILPIELQDDEKLGNIPEGVDILFKPLIYNEFEDKIIRYL